MTVISGRTEALEESVHYSNINKTTHTHTLSLSFWKQSIAYLYIHGMIAFAVHELVFSLGRGLDADLRPIHKPNHIWKSEIAVNHVIVLGSVCLSLIGHRGELASRSQSIKRICHSCHRTTDSCLVHSYEFANSVLKLKARGRKVPKQPFQP